MWSWWTFSQGRRPASPGTRQIETPSAPAGPGGCGREPLRVGGTDLGWGPAPRPPDPAAAASAVPPPSPAPDRPPSGSPLASPQPPTALDVEGLAQQLAERVAELVEAARTPPPLLTEGEVAARLNVSPRTVQALVADGEIPVVRIGTGRGVRRFDPAAVEAFIRRNARSL